jgi:hypothetical protein
MIKTFIVTECIKDLEFATRGEIFEFYRPHIKYHYLAWYQNIPYKTTLLIHKGNLKELHDKKKILVINYNRKIKK